jgi:hypothetical protein
VRTPLGIRCAVVHSCPCCWRCVPASQCKRRTRRGPVRA